MDLPNPPDVLGRRTLSEIQRRLRARQRPQPLQFLRFDPGGTFRRASRLGCAACYSSVPVRIVICSFGGCLRAWAEPVRILSQAGRIPGSSQWENRLFCRNAFALPNSRVICSRADIAFDVDAYTQNGGPSPIWSDSPPFAAYLHQDFSSLTSLGAFFHRTRTAAFIPPRRKLY